MSETRFGVVGAGAVGMSAAVELASRGVSVTVFEREEPGSGATGRAAGICYDAYADGRDAAIATDSLERFRELGLLRECPYLWFAREDDEVAEAVESQARRMREHGLDVTLLDSAGVAERFPALVTDDIETAALARNAGYVDTTAYLDALAGHEGITVRTGSPASVTRDGAVRAGDGRTDYEAVLVAAGAGTRQVFDRTDVDLAVGLYRTQVVTAGEREAEMPMFYDASEEWYARPTADGVLAGDGSHRYEGLPEEYARAADEEFIGDRMAALDGRIEADLTARDSWAGLCTATPDGDPLLGECSPGIYVATGFCGHGFMRAPVLGGTVAGQMLGGDGIDAFDPRRFDGDEAIPLPLGVTD